MDFFKDLRLTFEIAALVVFICHQIKVRKQYNLDMLELQSWRSIWSTARHKMREFPDAVDALDWLAIETGHSGRDSRLHVYRTRSGEILKSMQDRKNSEVRS